MNGLITFLTELKNHGTITWDFDEQQRDSIHEHFTSYLPKWITVLKPPSKTEVNRAWRQYVSDERLGDPQDSRLSRERKAFTQGYERQAQRMEGRNNEGMK